MVQQLISNIVRGCSKIIIGCKLYDDRHCGRREDERDKEDSNVGNKLCPKKFREEEEEDGEGKEEKDSKQECDGGEEKDEMLIMEDEKHTKVLEK